MHLSRVSSLSCDGSNHLWRRFESLYSQMLKRFKCICNPSSTSVSSLWKYPLTVWCAYYIHYLCQKFPLVIYLIADNASIPQLVVADSLFCHSVKQQAPYFHRICRPGSARFDSVWQGFAFPSRLGCRLEGVSWINAKKVSPLIQLQTRFISYNFIKISTTCFCQKCYNHIRGITARDHSCLSISEVLTPW